MMKKSSNKVSALPPGALPVDAEEKSPHNNDNKNNQMKDNKAIIVPTYTNLSARATTAIWQSAIPPAAIWNTSARSPRSLTRESFTRVEGAAKHPISQMVFTASIVGLTSMTFFYLQSLPSPSDLTTIHYEKSTGGLGRCM